MRFLIGTSVLACVLAINSATYAAPRHYDCTKAGNADKAACKADAATPAAAVPAAPVAASPAKTGRTYDCSKAGNKNKAACKAPVASAAPSPAPMRPSAPAAAPAPRPMTTAAGPAAAPAPASSPRVVTWTQKNGKVVHYDCSKAGNFNKKACKS